MNLIRFLISILVCLSIELVSGLSFGPIGKGKFKGIGVGRNPLGGKPGLGNFGGIAGKYRANSKQARAIKKLGGMGGMKAGGMGMGMGGMPAGGMGMGMGMGGMPAGGMGMGMGGMTAGGMGMGMGGMQAGMTPAKLKGAGVQGKFAGRGGFAMGNGGMVGQQGRMKMGPKMGGGFGSGMAGGMSGGMGQFSQQFGRK